MSMRATMVVVASTVWLVSCSGGGETQASAAGGSPEQSGAAGAHPWTGQVEALGKARAVADQLQAAAARQRRAIGE